MLNILPFDRLLGAIGGISRADQAVADKAGWRSCGIGFGMVVLDHLSNRLGCNSWILVIPNIGRRRFWPKTTILVMWPRGALLLLVLNVAETTHRRQNRVAERRWKRREACEVF